MLTGDPPLDSAPTSSRRRIWPWAAGSILFPLIIIAATLVGHRLAAQARLAAEVAPAPALPPLTVSAAITAPGQIAHLTLDASSQTLIAQVIGATGAERNGVAFYDSRTGALRAFVPVSSAYHALTDTTRGVTYLLDIDYGVTIYADGTGQRVGGYANAFATHATAVGLDERRGVIFTVDPATGGAASSIGDLHAFSANDGAPFASVALPADSALPPPQEQQMAVDVSTGRVYVFAGSQHQPQPLFAYTASDLTPVGSWLVPAGAQFGGLDAATQTVLFGRWDGAIWHVERIAEPVSGTGQTLAPQELQSLEGATRFGFDSATHTQIRMDESSVTASTVDASGAAQPYGALPFVRALLVSQEPLPVDGQGHLAYLPGDDDSILFVSLARPSSRAAPNALTAALIARAGMAKLLPDTHQNPPFVSASTFPLTSGTVARQYYIRFSDLGWQGPFAGTASLSKVTAGATPGNTIMTLNITWRQRFLRQHSWTVEVTSDGRTHLLSESGDAIP